jgi:hypothetical protein
MAGCWLGLRFVLPSAVPAAAAAAARRGRRCWRHPGGRALSRRTPLHGSLAPHQVVKLKAFSKFQNTTEALAAATALVDSKLDKGAWRGVSCTRGPGGGGLAGSPLARGLAAAGPRKQQAWQRPPIARRRGAVGCAPAAATARGAPSPHALASLLTPAPRAGRRPQEVPQKERRG